MLKHTLHIEFTAIIERDGKSFIVLGLRSRARMAREVPEQCGFQVAGDKEGKTKRGGTIYA